MNIKKLLVGVAAIVFVAAISFSGCSKGQGNSIKIGCIFPLTGSGSLWGQNGKMGVELATEEINSKGGIDGKKLDILFEDSHTEPTVAVSAFRKLVDLDGIQACIVDMISSNVLAVAPIADKDKVVIISPGASSPKITGSGPYVFRNWPSDALQGTLAAEFAFEQLKWRKAGVFWINNEYGQGLRQVFAKHFTEIGGKISVEEPFDQGSREFKTAILKLKKSPMDGLYLIGYPEEVPVILKELAQLHVRIPILGTETFQDPSVLKEGSKSSEPIYYLIPGVPDSNNAVVRHFREAFEKRFGQKPGVPADVAYDAVYILKWAIDRVGYDGPKIKDQLYKMKDWQGASGVTTFDSYGDAIKPYDAMTIKGGKFVLYKKLGD